ncbi:MULTISPECIES: helix-turn-helix domain-containing protein [Chryseobacterium]|uniref:helix-turn-helix domain-containing protein n=1 Tax=Chryseobacterium TaxID=59732 RepID=UPI001EF96765|nr:MULTISPECIES: AraC family transcriptional regulator [Chryseobacterium]MBM7421337.1 AraC-like DNA-binding protein [Chryseobacterium sp. JUb44]MDH6211298.1 AraC-like DNA-binding protein [Chryseobacterium sp. BIGb0186]WSO09956.1 AraC family transcriptional regulator [Chryseobacterium scophthalmum]
MDVQQNENLKTISYSGIFLSCFYEKSEKCIEAAPEHILVYLYSGEQIIENNKERIKLKAGECAFIRRDHRVVMSKNGKGKDLYKGISLTFNRNVLREFYSKMNKAELPRKCTLSDKSIFKLAPRADIISLFQSLTPYFDEKVKPTEAIANLKLLEGIYAILNNSEIFYPILFDFTEPWKVDIMDFLNRHYADDLTMEQIAAYTGRSLATFKRDFTKISNLTPQKWLIKKRLEAAYIKLKEEGKKVNDVYVEVGFKNPSHFSIAFKKQYGIPPNKV